MGRRRSVRTLLSNYACRVAVEERRSARFTCRGLGQTLMFAATGIAAALTMVSYVILVRAGGDPGEGLLGAVMGLTVAYWSLTLAVRRYRRHGEFELDAERGVLRRYRAGFMVGEFDLDLVDQVGLVIDPTDGVRMSSLPSWLQVTFCTGEVFRIAKGSPQELAPVCAALRHFGLPA